MKLVVAEERGVLSLAYTWLPTWIGMNNTFNKEMERVLSEKLVGLPMDEAGLEKANKLVLDYICEKNPGVKGLYEYLDALKYVSLE